MLTLETRPIQAVSPMCIVHGIIRDKTLDKQLLCTGRCLCILSPESQDVFPLEGEPTAKSQNHRSERWEGDGGLHQDRESSILFFFLVWHRGPVLPAVEVQSLNPWTSREVPPALVVR